MKVFEVTFRCGNCGNKWVEQFEKGDKLEGTYLRSHRCDHTIACQHCRRIICPICDAGKEISTSIEVIKREPLVKAGEPC